MAITAIDIEFSSSCSLDKLTFGFDQKNNPKNNSIICCGQNNQARCFEAGYSNEATSWDVTDNAALCIVTRSPNIRATFSSDSSVTGKGFIFRYFPVESSNMSSCGQYVKVEGLTKFYICSIRQALNNN